MEMEYLIIMILIFSTINICILMYYIYDKCKKTRNKDTLKQPLMHQNIV